MKESDLKRQLLNEVASQKAKKSSPESIFLYYDIVSMTSSHLEIGIAKHLPPLDTSTKLRASQQKERLRASWSLPGTCREQPGEPGGACPAHALLLAAAHRAAAQSETRILTPPAPVLGHKASAENWLLVWERGWSFRTLSQPLLCPLASAPFTNEILQ